MMYLTKTELLEAFNEAKEQQTLTPRLARHLLEICKQYSKHKNFCQYHDRDELISAGIEKLCNIWHKPTNTSNLFAFYTLCAHRAFLGAIIKQNRYYSRHVQVEIQEPC